MSGFEHVNAVSDIVYTYDGSFPGFLCCVFESVYSLVLPFDIVIEGTMMTLLKTKYIKTDHKKAERVRASIPAKISERALELVCTVFLSCLEQKEMKLLRFLVKGYKEGKGIVYKLGDINVVPLVKAEKHLYGEAYLLRGFVRFSDVGNGLVSVISPKNYVLPFISNHFISRYSDEDFMIFDKTHKAALIYQDRKSEILQVENVEIPEVSEKEAMYQSLWKRFYNTVAIEGRENPRCRMTHMPKRYWENMLEVKELL